LVDGWVFAFTALGLAMFTARIASTTPDYAPGMALASPTSTARAAWMFFLRSSPTERQVASKSHCADADGTPPTR
jgi:hypothetical protein